MLDHFIAKNSTAHKVNSYCTLAISYCTFCVGKHTILGPALEFCGEVKRAGNYVMGLSSSEDRMILAGVVLA